jgi:hypothetical protein
LRHPSRFARLIQPRPPSQWGVIAATAYLVTGKH